MFQTFRGSPALSEFRIQGLMQKFQQNQLPVKSVYAEYLHFVELNRPLVSEQEAKLKALLHYGPTLTEHDAKGETFIVIPRVGTISSWSSKATDIAHNCGLNEVERIERGLAYYFELSQLFSKPLFPCVLPHSCKNIFQHQHKNQLISKAFNTRVLIFFKI